MSESSKDVGKQGERLSRSYLEQCGYTIRAENHREGNLEIDIIAFDPVREELVFVEVKTRKFAQKEGPEAAVDGPKQAALVAAAEAYLFKTDQEDALCRFDVVAVTLEPTTRISHFVDAFWAE